MLTRLKINNFTVFKQLDINFSKGINIFIGENGTGKTHLMKMLYSACCVADEKARETLTQKVTGVFLPNSIGRLVKRTKGSSKGDFTVYRKEDENDSERYIRLELTNHNNSKIVNLNRWHKDKRYHVVFIPVKDMLANAPGFRSLYAEHHLHVEEIYIDILDKALIPTSKGPRSKQQNDLLNIIQEAIDGKVIEKNENFYLKNQQGELEFSLLAEGYRKLGLLYTLIQNGVLTQGSILFWDEPESNLNPKLSHCVVKIIIELQRMGVQVFLTTHDYVLLKEFDLNTQEQDEVWYHSLYHTGNQDETEIQYTTNTDFNSITHNAIDDTYDSLLSQEINRDLN